MGFFNLTVLFFISELHRYFFSLVGVRLFLAIFFIARIDVVVGVVVVITVVVSIATRKLKHIFSAPYEETSFPWK